MGDYHEDKKEGEGTLEWPDGRVYQGPWKNGKQHGRGKFKNRKGDVKMGEWYEGKRVWWYDENGNRIHTED